MGHFKERMNCVSKCQKKEAKSSTNTITLCCSNLLKLKSTEVEHGHVCLLLLFSFERSEMKTLQLTF